MVLHEFPSSTISDRRHISFSVQLKWFTRNNNPCQSLIKSILHFLLPAIDIFHNIISNDCRKIRVKMERLIKSSKDIPQLFRVEKKGKRKKFEGG